MASECRVRGPSEILVATGIIRLSDERTSMFERRACPRSRAFIESPAGLAQRDPEGFNKAWFVRQTLHRIVMAEAIPHYWLPFCSLDADIDQMVR
jgi:hypothetical protein